MHNLPSPDVYEQEYTFLPWGKLIGTIVVQLQKHVPRDGKVLDLMCGTGFLLRQLQERRPDLRLSGIDLDSEYLKYARANTPNTTFTQLDVLTGLSKYKGAQFDVVTCTAGIHHVPDEDQERIVRHIHRLVRGGGYALIADPYIGEFTDERQRMVAGAELGYHYLVEAIKRGASRAVVDAAIGVLRNDVMQIEWKTSHKRQFALLKKVFGTVKFKKTWPDHSSDYGDYYYICHK